MAATMQVNVVSAEASIYTGSAYMLIAPAAQGEIGVLAHHTPLIAQIKPGVVRIKPADGGEEISVYVSGGILEVQPTCVTVLADTAVRSQDLDEAKAIAAKQAAEESLQNSKGSMDHARAHIELAQAVAQLAAIKKLRKY